MAVALPLVGGVLFTVVLLLHGNSWREAVLKAGVLWSVCGTLSLEFLSPFHGVRPGVLGGTWAVIDLGALVWAVAAVFHRSTLSALSLPRLADVRSMDTASRALAGGVIAAIAIVGVVAISAAPNTWDAMTYHLPRLAHWLDNRSVAFYPTNILRQLHMGPGAEYLMFQLYALLGNDRLVSTVQWASYIGSIIGVTLLARSMGAGVRGQVIAGVVCATIPQGVLSASGPKNDYVLAFWLVAATWFLFEYARFPGPRNAAWTGGAAGLALLTKATAVLYVLPIGLVWWVVLTRGARQTALRHAPIAIFLIALLNAGQVIRNTEVYGAPFGPPSEGAEGAYKYTNDAMSPGLLLSNVLRNIALHLATPSESVNRGLHKAIGWAIRASGTEPDDPRTTWTSTAFEMPRFSLNENLAGNPIHVVLALAALLFLLSRRSAAPIGAWAMAVGLTGAFVLFCLVLKWQPWHARLHLPLFVVGGAVVGVAMDRALPAAATTTIGALLLVMATPFLLANELRPLVSLQGTSILTTDRISQYFLDNPADRADYVRTADLVLATGCLRVGLDIGSEWLRVPMVCHASRPAAIDRANIDPESIGEA